MKPLIKIMGLMLVLLGTTTACEKENRPTATMAIRLQDYPGATRTPYEAVNIDIRQVQVYYESGTWSDLRTQAGVYDLLKLRNGRTAYLVKNQLVASGAISQIKIIPGTRNTVKTGGKSYPILVEAHDQAGMVVPVAARISANDVADIVIGFDAEGSIAVDGENLYRLKPSLRVFLVDVDTPGAMPR